MLCTKQETIADRIICELAREPHQELSELIEKIAPQLKKKMTLQAWYKVVKNLVNSAVIVKEGKRYSLNIVWLAGFLRLAQTIQSVYIEEESQLVIDLPTKANQKIVYRFRDPLALDKFWGHLLTHIASKRKGVNVYAYNLHFWFYLAHGPTERMYNQSMIEYQAHTYMIIGSRSFLDTWNKQFFPKEYFSYWLSPYPLYKDQRVAYNYIGGYFLEIKIHKDIARRIDDLFSRTESLADVSEMEVISLFQQKGLCTLSVSLADKEAEAFKRKIARYF